MFARIARFVIDNPWKVVAAWILAAVALVPVAPSLSSVTNSDQASFLPRSYESVKANVLAARYFPDSAGATATFVVARGDGGVLLPADGRAIGAAADALQRAHIAAVVAVATGGDQLAPNRRVQLVQVAFRGQSPEPAVQDAIVPLRARMRALLRGSGLRAGLTGDAGITVDSNQAYADAETIIGFATIALILVLLCAIFRSPVAAVLPIVCVGLVYLLAKAAIALAAKALGLQVSNELGSLLIVILFGVGTDYVVFLLYRYRERLRAGEHPTVAAAGALAKVGEVIASSALAVIAAFGALLLSQLGDLRAMAPGLVIAVALMLLAGLTLVPAIVALLGTRAFWPSAGGLRPARAGLAARFGTLMGRRPELLMGIAAALLVALAAGTPSYRANYDSSSGLPVGTESARAYNDLKTAFPAGALNPTQVYAVGPAAITGAQVRALAGALRGARGVGTVFPAQISPDGRAVQMTLYLAASPYSAGALDAVAGPIRAAAHAAVPGLRVAVGGTTAAYADIRTATNRDLTVIFPAAAALIALVLVLLLRSVVAPLYLLAAVDLGFTSTLGATVAVFQGLAGYVGLDFSLPIIMYLFVVAIGTDYNILMMARLREEFDAGHTGRSAATIAVARAGGTVLAAAIILAGSFGSLALSGIGSLQQLGFAVAIGILIAAALVAGVLVPGGTALLGDRIWWPRRPSRTAGEAAQAPVPPTRARLDDRAGASPAR